MTIRFQATRHIRSLLVATAATTALVLTGCGSDSGDHTADTTTDETSEASETAPAPEAADLRDQLTQLVDPAVPVDTKVTFVENGENHRLGLEAASAALANYPLSFEITNVTVEDKSATADVAVESPHGTAAPTPWQWAYTDDSWKVSESNTCALLEMARVPAEVRGC